MQSGSPIFELVICLGALVAFVIYPWVWRVSSVGLPLCYIVSLAMIHWLGGLIHALPLPRHSESDPYTEAGFRQAFWGIVAFATGSLLVTPFVLRLFVRGETTAVLQIRARSNVDFP